jgi:hypothetical protein
MSKRNTLIRLVVALAAMPAAGLAIAAEDISITVVVKQKDKGPQAAPFPNVAGFLFKRALADYVGATCPDASNDKGELTCRLSCAGNDTSLRVLLVAPQKDRATIVAGMSPPPAVPIDIEKCKVRNRLPVELVYKTAYARAEELKASDPALFNSVATLNGKSVEFKSFATASPQLRQIAQDKSRHQALLELAEVARLYEETPGTSKTASASTLAEYEAGVTSVVLQAKVGEAMGSKATGLVKVSPAPEELQKSLSNVSKALNTKPVLNQSEIGLSRAVSELRIKNQVANQPAARGTAIN